jgi:hypothetical protein
MADALYSTETTTRRQTSRQLQQTDFPGELFLSGTGHFSLAFSDPEEEHLATTISFFDESAMISFRDEAFRRLEAMLIDAQRNLEVALREMNVLPLPSRFDLQPLRRERLQLKIGKNELAKFHFVDDE